MALNIAQKLIESHLVDGGMTLVGEIALKVDQVSCCRMSWARW